MADPRQIGNYEVLEVLGRGGMGIVYKARDTRIERYVALKLMTQGIVEDDRMEAYFFREAKISARLDHPNIVTLYDVGVHEQTPYLVMQFLKGNTLARQIQENGIDSIGSKLDVLGQICRGLQYAHEQGVVHRDIKPANIMVLPDGQAKILDFGIARIMDVTTKSQSAVVGTLAYMSPEQLSGKKVDARSDIYSCGVVAYELLTGISPFDAGTAPATMMRVMQDNAPPLRQYLPECPPALERSITVALEKDREKRYETAEHFRIALSESLRGLQAGSSGRVQWPSTTPKDSLGISETDYFREQNSPAEPIFDDSKEVPELNPSEKTCTSGNSPNNFELPPVEDHSHQERPWAQHKRAAILGLVGLLLIAIAASTLSPTKLKGLWRSDRLTKKGSKNGAVSDATKERLRDIAGSYELLTWYPTYDRPGTVSAGQSAMRPCGDQSLQLQGSLVIDPPSDIDTDSTGMLTAQFPDYSTCNSSSVSQPAHQVICKVSVFADDNLLVHVEHMEAKYRPCVILDADCSWKAQLMASPGGKWSLTVVTPRDKQSMDSIGELEMKKKS